jgi:hypothetical protein
MGKGPLDRCKPVDTPKHRVTWNVFDNYDKDAILSRLSIGNSCHLAWQIALSGRMWGFVSGGADGGSWESSAGSLSRETKTSYNRQGI